MPLNRCAIKNTATNTIERGVFLALDDPPASEKSPEWDSSRHLASARLKMRQTVSVYNCAEKCMKIPFFF